MGSSPGADATGPPGNGGCGGQEAEGCVCRCAGCCAAGLSSFGSCTLRTGAPAAAWPTREVAGVGATAAADVSVVLATVRRCSCSSGSCANIGLAGGARPGVVAQVLERRSGPHAGPGVLAEWYRAGCCSRGLVGWCAHNERSAWCVFSAVSGLWVAHTASSARCGWLAAAVIVHAPRSSGSSGEHGLHRSCDMCSPPPIVYDC